MEFPNHDHQPRLDLADQKATRSSDLVLALSAWLPHQARLELYRLAHFQNRGWKNL
jgi:hypothetical protein